METTNYSFSLSNYVRVCVCAVREFQPKVEFISRLILPHDVLSSKNSCNENLGVNNYYYIVLCELWKFCSTLYKEWNWDNTILYGHGEPRSFLREKKVPLQWHNTQLHTNIKEKEKHAVQIRL